MPDAAHATTVLGEWNGTVLTGQCLGYWGGDGAFAELLSLPERNLHQIPDSISDEQAVFVEPLAAAFEITEQVSLKPEWSVAVVGDGRLAHLISQVLRLSCPNVSCFGRHKNKLARMERFGIATRIGIAFSDEQRFDLVVESSGSNSGFDDSTRLVRPRGIIVLKSTVASRGGQDLTAAVINEVTLVGSRCGACSCLQSRRLHQASYRLNHCLTVRFRWRDSQRQSRAQSAPTP